MTSSNKLMDRLERELRSLKETNNLRSLQNIRLNGKMIERGNGTMLNLSSNDYLGLASDEALHADFFSKLSAGSLVLSASSSRLMTGNFPEYAELETLLAELYGRESALVFNCGYHANTGILPAVADADTLILADKLVHASIIDGLRLSGARCVRYRHNNYEQLEELLRLNEPKYDAVIVVVESIYSMDGDVTDLQRLVGLKRKFGSMMLYVDEAHAVGVSGENGLGLAEELNCIAGIDFLVGTFGKALASVGAFVVCDKRVKDYLVNRMRPFIFTTALPPVNVAWTIHVMRHLPQMEARRVHLRTLNAMLQEAVRRKTGMCLSSSQIIPLVVGESGKTLMLAEELQRKGFYCMAVRPPTVAPGTSRIRFSLTAAMTCEEVVLLCNEIDKLKIE